ncbi:MAG: DNA polymerase III subunit gamma/tau C-terminal domain-containing protein, partial [Legionellales bacterium]
LSIGFSMTLLRMLTFRPAAQAAIPILTFQNTPPKEDATIIQELLQEKTVEPKPTIANPEINNPIIEKSIAPPIHNEDWANIVNKLNLTGFALTALENTEFLSKDGREVRLGLAKGHQSLFTPSTLSRIEAALSEYYQSTVKIVLETKDSIQATIAQQKNQVTQQKQHNAEEALLKDPLFQQLQQEFSAELVKNSIVPLKDGL